MLAADCWGVPSSCASARTCLCPPHNNTKKLQKGVYLIEQAQLRTFDFSKKRSTAPGQSYIYGQKLSKRQLLRGIPLRRTENPHLVLPDSNEIWTYLYPWAAILHRLLDENICQLLKLYTPVQKRLGVLWQVSAWAVRGDHMHGAVATPGYNFVRGFRDTSLSKQRY
jgi:hypothetical protein